MKDVANKEERESYRQNIRHLINQAEMILQRIKVGDVFGIGSQEEYIDDDTLRIGEQWAQRVHDVGALSFTRLGQELCGLWFINGNRVNSTSIKRAIEILKQI